VLAEAYAHSLGKKPSPEPPTDAKNFTLGGPPSYALQEIDTGENEEEDLNFSHSDWVVSSDALPVNTRLR